MMSFTTEELNAGFMSTTLLNNYFHYFTGTNKLEKISPTAGGTVTAPFATNNRSFTSYDLNGNLTADGLRGTNLLYDRANLPYRVSNGNTTYAFGYNTADARIFKGNDNQAYYYLAGSVYDMKNDKWEHYPGGLAVHKNNSLHLIIKDHLTNTRAIVMDGTDNCAGSMGYQAQYDYYPYGKVLRKVENPRSRFQSTDHETDLETGYNNRNARWYDDESFQFLQIDQFSNDYPSWSPYHYAARNPIYIIDPSGNSWFKHQESGAVFWDESTEKSKERYGQTFDNVGEFTSWTKKLIDGSTIMLTGGEGGEINYHFPNKYGLVRMPESGNGFDRYSNNTPDKYNLNGVYGAHGDNWISPKSGSALFNTIQEFNKKHSNTIVHYGDISAFNPNINLGHKTHTQGNAIDIHYMGKDGKELIGKKSYLNADVELTNSFFEIAQKYEFTKNIRMGVDLFTKETTIKGLTKTTFILLYLTKKDDNEN